MTDVLRFVDKKKRVYQILNEGDGEKGLEGIEADINKRSIYYLRHCGGDVFRHPYRAAIRECLPVSVSSDGVALIINQGG